MFALIPILVYLSCLSYVFRDSTRRHGCLIGLLGAFGFLMYGPLAFCAYIILHNREQMDA